MRRWMTWLAALSILGVTASCGAPAVRKAELAAADLLISEQQELALGEQIHQELANQGIRYVDDPAVEQYVNRVAAPILAQAKKERPEMDWHVHVIDQPDQVNAFATPGGHIYLFTGLLLNMDSEAELAGVLAHEAGHIVQRHAARAMVQQFGLAALTRLALGQDPGAVAQIAAQIAGTGAVLHHSRAAEYEADTVGAWYAARANYDPQGLVTFLGKLAQGGKTPQVLAWLSTHPTSEARVARLQTLIQQNNLAAAGGGRNDGLAQIQQRLRAESRPAAPGTPQPPQTPGARTPPDTPPPPARPDQRPPRKAPGSSPR